MTKQTTATARPEPETLQDFMRSHVGAEIKKRRQKADLTAGALAELVGVGIGQVFRWEAGNNELTFAGLAKLADALVCQIGDLFPKTTAIIRARRELE